MTKGTTCDAKKMFGYPVVFINGNMLAGIFATRLFFRIPIGDQAGWKARSGDIRGFEPVAGRAMKEYLEISALDANLPLMKELMAASAGYVQVLPEKAKKTQKGR